VIRCFALSSDGKLLAAACGDGAAYVWSLPEKKLAAKLENHKLAVLSVSFGKDGKFLATGSADASIEVWDTATWKPGAEGKTYPGDVVRRCFLKSSSKSRGGGEGTSGWRHSFAFILGGRQTKTIEVRGDDRTPGYARDKFIKVPMGSGTPLDFVSAKDKYYVACSDNTVKEFTPVTAARKTTLVPTATLRGHNDWVYAVALSADGQRLASASGDGTVKLWSTEDNRLLGTLVQLVPGTDDWLIVAGQGYFAASNPAAVEWKDTEGKTSPEKLAGLQNPEMVKKSLAGEKTPAANLQ
jgi:WD40 repeat protein